mgnify:FL=1
MKEDKYLTIIEAAVEILQDENYQSMKTALIAEKASIAEGTIYRYFKNKREIFQKVVEESLTILEQNTFLNVKKDNSFILNLEQLEKNYKIVKENCKKYYTIKYKAYSEVEDDIVKKLLLESSHNEIKKVESIFLWAKEKKEIKTEDRLIETIPYMILGFSHYMMRLHTVEFPEEKIENEIKHLIFYIKKMMEIKNIELGVENSTN